MKKMTVILVGSLIALSLSAAFAGTGFKPVANPPSVSLFGSAGAYGIATSATWIRSKTTPDYMSMSMTVVIREFGLGAIGNDLPSGYLKIVSVKGHDGVSVLLTRATPRADDDQLKFFVGINAGTPKGVYPMVVAIENKLTGDNGTVTLTVDVR